MFYLTEIFRRYMRMTVHKTDLFRFQLFSKSVRRVRHVEIFPQPFSELSGLLDSHAMYATRYHLGDMLLMPHGTYRLREDAQRARFRRFFFQNHGSSSSSKVLPFRYKHWMIGISIEWFLLSLCQLTLMVTGPEGNWVDGNIEILGKQNLLFPKVVILKVIFYMAKQISAKQNKQHQATFNCTLWSDHMQQRSTVTTFPFDVIVFAMFPAHAFGGEQLWHC